MWTRRDVIKGSVSSLAIGVLAREAPAEPPVPTVFENATARFDPNDQHKLPDWAFTCNLPTPLTIRPRSVGAFADVFGKAVFGPQDLLPIGEVFHGTAIEWGTTPSAWKDIGCKTRAMPEQGLTESPESWKARCRVEAVEGWEDKRKCFGDVVHVSAVPEDSKLEEDNYDKANKSVTDPTKRVANWGHFPVKCYKVPVLELERDIQPNAKHPARLYGYAGMVPGPLFKFRHGQPAVVRYENHLENEISVHLHGGHTPSHSDGFPSFYVLPGKSRDYFYPNVIPVKNKAAGDNDGPIEPELGESLSTMWYHDHGMDATAFNVSKGLAGMAMFYTDWELALVRDHVLPGLGKASIVDPDEQAPVDAAEAERRRRDLEHPEHPGFYAPGKEPYHNPYDLPLVLQDKVIDPETGQIAYDGDAHNGYLGNTFFVNGVAWPVKNVVDRKYRLRVLDGSNSRIYRLRILSKADFDLSQKDGLTAEQLQERSHEFLRIGKDSCLWREPFPVKDVVLAMANRADLIVDFAAMRKTGGNEFVLVNTMPQTDGRGPNAKLEDGGDPAVLPLPFPTDDRPLRETKHPIALMKFVVGDQTDAERQVPDATVCVGMPIAPFRPRIEDHEIRAVREFIFHRRKGAWQVNNRFYDPTISNACPRLTLRNTYAEEWVLRNGGGGWWHPIHIHLESHQLVSYEKDFGADEEPDPDEPPINPLAELQDLTAEFMKDQSVGNHDTQVLGPNTVARIRMRFRTWPGPFVFHCHNLEHEDMRMMHNFEPVPGPHDPNVTPAARTHGNALTLNGHSERNTHGAMGELPWEGPPVPETPVREAGESLITSRDAKPDKQQ